MVAIDADLLGQWTHAITTLDFEHVKQLTLSLPKLLWTPLGDTERLGLDLTLLDNDSRRLKLLGGTLEPLPALAYCLLSIAYSTQSGGHDDRIRPICFFLIEQSSTKQLNSCRWGSGNTVLHLACFLDEVQIATRLLVSGASSVIHNQHGYLPKDVAQTDEIAELLSLKKQTSKGGVMGTSDRFKQLRLLAESPTAKTPVLLDRQKSSRKYFLPGHVEERKRRVLDDDEEIEREKQRILRQREVETLTARSAVKNNPLFKKWESKNALTVPAPIQEGEAAPRRSSKVISSLKDRSVVSTSVFRQSPNGGTAPRRPSPLASSDADAEIAMQDSDEEMRSSFDADAAMDQPSNEDNAIISAFNEESFDIIAKETAFESSGSVSESTESSTNFSRISQRSSISSKSTNHCSESDFEQWFDSVEDYRESQSRPTSKQQYGSFSPPPEMIREQGVNLLLTSHEAEPQERHDEKVAAIEQPDDVDYESDSDKETIRGFATAIKGSSNDNDARPLADEPAVKPPMPIVINSRPQSDNVESVDSFSPTTPQTIGSEPQKRHSKGHANYGDSAYGSISRRSTSLFKSRHLEEPSKTEEPHVNRGIPSVHEVSMAKGQKYAVVETRQATEYGKLYIHVQGVQSMLLPLPKETTYVRCVVSDGRYEYMSRYEVLGHRVLFDYECIVDTVPDMIITVSLHVRPDSHVKPHSGWSRLFSSIRKQKESLCGYVHPNDDAIGQTRFAVAHMMQACHQKPYKSDFECFNSWYARTARERQRRQKLQGEEEENECDVLKIVGNLSIEMLYMPVSCPAVAIPPTLRECNLTIRIREWHETCWYSGYLTTRVSGSKLWQRQFYQLVGSRFMGYRRQDELWAPKVLYDIADAVGLSAATDKVIVALNDDQDDRRLFKQEAICDDNRRGFFRITFPDAKLDCVSDNVDDSEQWVKTLAAMIGRIPLKIPYTVFENELKPISDI